MVLDVTELNFNSTRAEWRNVGIESVDTPLSAEQFEITGNEAVCTLQLPNEKALYTDYSSLIFWIHGDDGTTRPESRAGVSVPSSCVMGFDTDDDSYRELLTFILSGEENGTAELRIECENANALAALVSLVKAVTYLKPMWYTGYEAANALNPDIMLPENTVVMENLKMVLEVTSFEQSFFSILRDRKYLFSFDETYPLGEQNFPQHPSVTELRLKSESDEWVGGESIGNGLYKKGDFVYCSYGILYAVMKRKNYIISDSTTIHGYTREEAEEIIAGGVEYIDSKAGINVFINSVESTSMVNLHLDSDKVYFVNGSLHFEKSNICLVGHNSELRLKSDSTDAVSIIHQSNSSSIRNIEVCNIKLQGRARLINNNINVSDSCVRWYTNSSELRFPLNVTFNDVEINGFNYGVHSNPGAPLKGTALDWRFINCTLTRVRTGFMLTNVNGLLFSGGRVDDCLSLSKKDHCFYISEGCSNITVEKSLLENCAGGAIHQKYDNVSSSKKIEHTRYRDLTINNCGVGICIGGYGFDARAERITGEKIGRFIQLSYCQNVEIRDYYATGINDMNFALGEGDDYHTVKVDSYTIIYTTGAVKSAIIENCQFSDQPNFSFDGSMAYRQLHSSHYYKTPAVASDVEPGWIVDGYYSVDIIFKNCVFNLNSTVNDNIIIGTPKKHYCVNNLLFDNCSFNTVRTGLVSRSVFYIKGNPNKISVFTFTNSRGKYYILDENYNNSVLIEGYFFFRNSCNTVIDDNFVLDTNFQKPSSKKFYN